MIRPELDAEMNVVRHPADLQQDASFRVVCSVISIIRASTNKGCL
jgi:hypothetical protein